MSFIVRERFCLRHPIALGGLVQGTLNVGDEIVVSGIQDEIYLGRITHMEHNNTYINTVTDFDDVFIKIEETRFPTPKENYENSLMYDNGWSVLTTKS